MLKKDVNLTIENWIFNLRWIMRNHGRILSGGKCRAFPGLPFMSSTRQLCNTSEETIAGGWLRGGHCFEMRLDKCVFEAPQSTRTKHITLKFYSFAF